jgi:hypothetical protein
MEKHLPIIYVRGYAGSQGAVELLNGEDKRYETGRFPVRSLWIFRYYDRTSERAGDGTRDVIETLGENLGRLVRARWAGLDSDLPATGKRYPRNDNIRFPLPSKNLDQGDLVLRVRDERDNSSEHQH